MEIVYVFDKNYIPYFEMSVQSVLKYNPNANITVVSPEKLDISYKNVVIPIGKMKHRENDRITFIDRKYNYCYNRIYREPVENIVLLHFPSSEKMYMRLEYTQRGIFLS